MRRDRERTGLEMTIRLAWRTPRETITNARAWRTHCPKARRPGKANVPEPTNLAANIPAQLTEEIHQELLAGTGYRVERIVSLGHASPPGFWYDQPTPEWVLLVQGAARLRFEGEEQPCELGPGDYVYIRAHQRHRVEWTDARTPTVWLAIYHEATAP